MTNGDMTIDERAVPASLLVMGHSSFVIEKKGPTGTKAPGGPFLSIRSGCSWVVWSDEWVGLAGGTQSSLQNAATYHLWYSLHAF
jgi:hypothetical protein